jgi:hypothetical protein
MNYKVGDRVHVKKGVSSGIAYYDQMSYGYEDLPMSGTVEKLDKRKVVRVRLDNEKLIILYANEQHLIEPIKDWTLRDFIGKMEKILVRDFTYDPWQERYLVSILPHSMDQKYIVVEQNSEEQYINGEKSKHLNYRYAKVKPMEEEKTTIELIIKVNGEKVPLTTISEETLLEIRKGGGR